MDFANWSEAWLHAVEAQTSLAPLSWFHGSRVTTAHAHQCCIFQRDCAVANEIDYAWASIHDNGHVITACDVWLQQRIPRGSYGSIRGKYGILGAYCKGEWTFQSWQFCHVDSLIELPWDANEKQFYYSLVIFSETRWNSDISLSLIQGGPEKRERHPSHNVWIQ